MGAFRAIRSLRRDSAGGTHDRVLSSYTRARTRDLLLVHGYNVSRDDAESGLSEFARSFDDSRRSPDDDFDLVLWPGDGKVPILKTSLYPIRVKTAIACGEELARHLIDLRGPNGGASDLVIIAHSLGCRVVLEALLAYGGMQPYCSRRIDVILMAAAVPIDWIDQYRARIARWNWQIRVAHSDHDWVLKVAFPLGNKLVEPSLSAEAVGLRGFPESGCWSASHRAQGHGHGDYWTSGSIQSFVGSVLGRRPSQIPPRTVATRQLAQRSWEDVW
jgi:esterase/lipase superfamily enzyme